MEILLLVITLFVLLYFFWQETQKHKTFRAKNKLDRSLDKKLLTMLHGDHQAALT